MDQISLILIIMVATLALIDFIPRIFVAKKQTPSVGPSYGRTPKYIILPTVYGDISYLKNLTFLKKYSSNVIVCTSSQESAVFYSALRKVCRENNLRYVTADVPIVKGKVLKNPYTIYRGVLSSGRLRVSNNTPCILIDADTYAPKNVNNLVRSFVSSQYDLASLRCEVNKPNSTIERLQEFEYRLAMDNRNMDPWLTSGACSIGKAGVLKTIFKKHSNFFAGGDIEIGKLAQIMGFRIGYLNFTFLTDAPNKFNDWFKQRIIWFSGGFRHHVINIGSFGWWHFFLMFYNSFLIYLLFPIRWVEFVNLPILLPMAMIFSWLYIFVLTGKKSWQPAYMLLPFYSFIQTMVILPLAFLRYVSLAWDHKSLGLIQQDLSRFSTLDRLKFRSLNIASASMVVIAAVAFTYSRAEYWSQNSTITDTLRALFASL